MIRKVFFTFHFDNDFWQTQMVRNMGSLDGQTLATANKWEELKRTSDQAVRDWIGTHMKGLNPTKVRKVTLPFPYPAGVPSFSSRWRLPILGDDPGG